MQDLTSKQRAFLRSLLNSEDAIFHIGKSGITPEFTKAVDDALEAREIVKISILGNCEEEPRALAEILHGRTRSAVVQVIGRKFSLYRKSKSPKITLPK